MYAKQFILTNRKEQGFSMRKLDELGRVVIPLEYRRQLGWQEKDDIEMILTDNSIVLKKAVDGCIFCNAAIDLVKMGNCCICRDCINRLHEAKNGDVLYAAKID